VVWSATLAPSSEVEAAAAVGPRTWARPT
jgi:hypothetical protein